MLIIRLFDSTFEKLDQRLASWLIPTLARAVFGVVLLVYYWSSAATKISDGVFGFLLPTAGAYVQIFPKAMEAVGYDPSQLSPLHAVIVYAGTYAEFILPLLIVIGLLTRLAAFGMIGFVIVQSYVDITGHNAADKDIGGWLDPVSGSLILDQRTLWIFLLLILLLKGDGGYGLDRLFLGRDRSDNKG